MKRIVLFTLIAFSLFSCKDDDDNNEEEQRRVNQTQFLKNSTHIINESYQAVAVSTQTLAQKASNLKDGGGQMSSISQLLPELKTNLREAWLAWQKVSFYEFESASQLALKSNVNIYKTDTAKIEANIRSGNFDLDQLSMKNAKGFPALDYLLNHKEESELITILLNDSNRRKYIAVLTSDIESRINSVSDSWNSNNASFEGNTGTDVGSSTGMMINALNQHYEKYFRDNKIGIPLGVRSSGIQRLDFVESAYGQYSLDLAIENFQAMKRFYLGYDASGNNGYGLDNYLADLNVSDLDQRIKNQLDVIEMKVKGLSSPLANQIQTDADKVQDCYNEIQKLIVLWKVDMPSIMGVLITFQDNDGD